MKFCIKFLVFILSLNLCWAPNLYSSMSPEANTAKLALEYIIELDRIQALGSHNINTIKRIAKIGVLQNFLSLFWSGYKWAYYLNPRAITLNERYPFLGVDNSKTCAYLITTPWAIFSYLQGIFFIRHDCQFLKYSEKLTLKNDQKFGNNINEWDLKDLKRLKLIQYVWLTANKFLPFLIQLCFKTNDAQINMGNYLFYSEIFNYSELLRKIARYSLEIEKFPDTEILGVIPWYVYFFSLFCTIAR